MLEKDEFLPFEPIPSVCVWDARVGVVKQNICYHVAAFVIAFN